MRFVMYCLCMAALFTGTTTLSAQKDPQIASIAGYSLDELRKLYDARTITGKGPQSAPPVNRPRYVTVSDASLSMDDDEVVFVVHYPDNIVRIYPQRIMLWHQVINDILPDASGTTYQLTAPEAAGRAYTITYSPLTGTVVGFRSFAGKFPAWFGTTGDVLNNNTMLYDTTSASMWNQLLGTCIDGPMIGKRLDRIPVLWATWKGVKYRYNGKAEVLSRSTGFKRTYGRDPYGSYQKKGTYYDNNTIYYPLAYLDTRLPPKKRVLGIETEALFGAVQVDTVKQLKCLNFTLGITPMVALYDEEIDAIRVFIRQLDRPQQTLTFDVFENKFVDTETKTEWSPEGLATYGKLREQALKPVLAIDTMWMSWSAFHRASRIFPEPLK